MIQNLSSYRLDHLCSVTTNFQNFFNSYRYIHLNYKSASQNLIFLHYSHLIQSLDVAQFLDVTPFFILSNRFSLSFALASVTFSSAHKYIRVTKIT